MPTSYVSSIKYLVLSLTFIIFMAALSIVLPTFAQTTALEKAKADYSFQFSKYREIQKEYQSAKSQYESFKTATSKNEA